MLGSRLSLSRLGRPRARRRGGVRGDDIIERLLVARELRLQLAPRRDCEERLPAQPRLRRPRAQPRRVLSPRHAEACARRLSSRRRRRRARAAPAAARAARAPRAAQPSLRRRLPPRHRRRPGPREGGAAEAAPQDEERAQGRDEGVAQGRELLGERAPAAAAEDKSVPGGARQAGNGHHGGAGGLMEVDEEGKAQDGQEAALIVAVGGELRRAMHERVCRLKLALMRRVENATVAKCIRCLMNAR
mmetsp:Transcript_28947/g.72162  ORF Transcript_28947/g.72162 Transcript_28947/m.72162 type:complete len:246 (+) Transcript_28947:683-1420(+)